MLTPKKKQVIMKKVQLHDSDTGSSLVQVAMLSERIEMLADHLKKHPKDNHSRRGLIKLVSERRKHEKYAATQKGKDGTVKKVAKKAPQKVLSKAITKKIAKKAAKKPMAKKVVSTTPAKKVAKKVAKK